MLIFRFYVVRLLIFHHIAPFLDRIGLSNHCTGTLTLLLSDEERIRERLSSEHQVDSLTTSSV